MSKKRFVDFYLSAMVKAATNGKVSRLTYDCKKEYVSITLADSPSLPVYVSVPDCDDCLKIALDVVKAVQKL